MYKPNAIFGKSQIITSHAQTRTHIHNTHTLHTHTLHNKANLGIKETINFLILAQVYLTKLDLNEGKCNVYSLKIILLNSIRNRNNNKLKSHGTFPAQRARKPCEFIQKKRLYKQAKITGSHSDISLCFLCTL